MVAGFFLGDAALLDEVCHERVVARDLLERPVVQQVGARIAHLGDDYLVIEDEGCGHGRAHARAAAAVFGAFEHGGVCLPDGFCERVGVGRMRGELAHRLDGDGACHLACLVPAHAVGDHEQRGRDEHAVLVMLAHVADVCQRAVDFGNLELLFCFAHERPILMSTLPTVMMSPGEHAVGCVTGRPLSRVPLVEPRSSIMRLVPMRVKRAWRADT